MPRPAILYSLRVNFVPHMALHTPLCDLLKIQHPIMVAGMGGVTLADLSAAASNCGGIGTIGAIGLSAENLRDEIQKVKKKLKPGVPFGVDLLLPAIGGRARKTNSDYTEGKLETLVDIMIEEHVPLFVCAVGIPPKWVCDKMHKAGIVVMNMIGAPHHVPKCLEVGCDIICAQGTEAGGHTGDVTTLVLVPACVDLVKGHKNYFGSPVQIVAAGGIVDGRGVAAAISLGATGVWCGTRFLMTPEANAPQNYKELMISARSTDTQRSLIFSGRPMRVLKNAVVKEWEGPRIMEQRELLGKGQVPLSPHTYLPPSKAVDTRQSSPNLDSMAMPMGQGVGSVKSIMPTEEIMKEMVNDAVEALAYGAMYTVPVKSKL